MNIRQKRLPIAVLEQIDDRCVAFERSWQKGEPQSIESVLMDEIAEEARDLLLTELIVLETDYRRRRGEVPKVEEYRDRFPEHVDEVNGAFDQEFSPKNGFKAPSINEIAMQFPSLEIQEVLGAGGMGAVYKAKQEGLDRVVALKILPPEFADDAMFSLRFTREARTLAKLNHPNIVSVFEFGQVQDTFYFLMEFVDGPTLREVVRAQELSPQQALSIVPHLCDALQYAHDHGVIHRDIKPENILLTRKGEVKIVDFGLSRILTDQEHAPQLTATHQVMGTPRYMAPEQFEGSHQVDHRADIYSLGVVFYELLTGELPVGRFEMPSQRVSIDVRLDDVVLRTLEKEPRLRYQSASEIKSDLKSIADSEDPARAITLIAEQESIPTSEATPEQQETAARLLLTRRDLMSQVRSALRPLFRWQLVQVLVGVGLIAVGARCWTQNTGVPPRLISGLVVHVYGVSLIASAIAILAGLKHIDFGQPVNTVKQHLEVVKRRFIKLSPLIGMPWWLMWIPVGVSAGFDPILHPNSLVPSLVVGVLGLVICLFLYYRAQSPSRVNAAAWKEEFAGTSFRNAFQLLNEMEQAGIG